MASNSKVSILDYFNIVFEGENGKIESNCKACGTRIQAKRSVTSNFVTHLKRKHQAMYDEFVKRKDMKREAYSSGSLHGLTATTANGGSACYSHTLPTGAGGRGAAPVVTKFDRHDPRQVLISEAIAKMIVRDLQPTSIVEKQGFRELLTLLEPRFIPESQRYIQSQLLPAYAYQAQLATRQALSSALALSLSLDLWRGPSRASAGSNTGYLGVTCHFLTSDWQMRSALLACLPLVGGSSANHVLAEFQEVCNAHGVTGQAFRVVADAYPAETRATCHLSGFHIYTNGEGEEEGKVDSGNDDAQGVDDRNGGNNGAGEGGEEVGAEWRDSWDQGLGVRRVNCFFRSLDACVRKGLSSCPQLSSALAKAACFYNYITSAVPTEKLNQVFGNPEGTPVSSGSPPPGERDWASQLKVLRRMLDCADFLEEVSGRGELALGSPERALLRELTDTLEPFAEAWDMVQGDRQTERHVSISLALPCVLGLRKHLSETSTPHCPSLLLGLAQGLECRLAPILEDPLYITATTLDPQFKLSWSSDDNWHRQVLLEELSKLSTAGLSPQNGSMETLPRAQSSPSQTPSPVFTHARPCKLFSFIKHRPTSQAKSLEQELAAYLHEEPTDEEPLHYWRRKAIDFPQLAQVAQKMFTVPASGSAVEAIFTIAGRCLCPEMGRVLPKNLETLIYLKANYRLLWM